MFDVGQYVDYGHSGNGPNTQIFDSHGLDGPVKFPFDLDRLCFESFACMGLHHLFGHLFLYDICQVVYGEGKGAHVSVGLYQ